MSPEEARARQRFEHILAAGSVNFFVQGMCALTNYQFIGALCSLAYGAMVWYTTRVWSKAMK